MAKKKQVLSEMQRDLMQVVQWSRNKTWPYSCGFAAVRILNKASLSIILSMIDGLKVPKK